MSVNLQGKKLAVVGGRDFADKDMLYRILTKNRDKIKLIVSGGARGADTLATDWATDYGMPFLVFPALWHNPETGEYDRGAGFRRNRDIVEHCDMVIAFWDGVSGGTQNTLKIAEQLGKPIKIFNYTPAAKKALEKAEKEAIQEEKENRQKVETELRNEMTTEPQAVVVSDALPETL